MVARQGMVSGWRETRRRGRAGILACLLLIGIAGCASAERDESDPVVDAATARFPACSKEIKAFVTLSRLALRSAGDSHVYRTALDAMRDQLADCVDDHYISRSNAHPLELEH